MHQPSSIFINFELLRRTMEPNPGMIGSLGSYCDKIAENPTQQFIA